MTPCELNSKKWFGMRASCISISSGTNVNGRELTIPSASVINVGRVSSSEFRLVVRAEKAVFIELTSRSHDPPMWVVDGGFNTYLVNTSANC